MKNRGIVVIGFWPIMFFIFLTLKLCSVIDWPWYWVTAPLWGPLMLVGAFGLLVVIGIGIEVLVRAGQKPKR